MKKIFLGLLTILILPVMVSASEVDLDIESSEVTSLYENLNVFRDYLGNGNLFGYLYMKDSYSVNDLSNSAKIMIGSYKLNKNNSNPVIENEYTVFTKEDMSEAIKSVLGNNITYVDGNFDVNSIDKGCGMPSKYENSKYYFYDGCGGTMLPYYNTKILKAVKTNKTIEIYENAIYILPKIDEGNDHIDIYTPDKVNLIGTIAIDNYMGNEENNFLNKGYIYKYTFKLDNDSNNYYFSKVEKVDQESLEKKEQEKQKTNSDKTNKKLTTEKGQNDLTNYYLAGGLALILLVIICILIRNKKKNGI